MQETWVLSLAQEDSLEEEMATHSVFLPGESHGQRSLESYSPWGRKESVMTEATEHSIMQHSTCVYRHVFKSEFHTVQFS